MIPRYGVADNVMRCYLAYLSAAEIEKAGTLRFRLKSGGCEIRTREAVTPTRFPSVRHRPLGESSSVLTQLK